MIMQLANLLDILYVDRIVVLEAFGNTFRDLQAVFDTRFVGFRQVLNCLLELRHAESFIIE
jgi:hypothetical protein